MGRFIKKKKKVCLAVSKKDRAKYGRISKANAAYRQVVSFLRHNGIMVPAKKKQAMRIFASELGFEFDVGYDAASMNDQLIGLYDDPDFKAIGRREPSFYWSPEWRVMRQEVFLNLGKKCLRCGSTENLHIDHIKPRSKYPELELVLENLQVLCMMCNLKKSNRDETNYMQVT